ncbi:MAG: site-specific integrase [Myxococcales bacterium]|nr:site-specific integrase [Myxococcales bacterium]
MTRLRHETTLRRYHLPKFAKVPLTAITRAEIARYQAELAQTVKGVSGGPAKPASINTIVMVLVTLLKYAAELGFLVAVPLVRRLKAPNQKKKAPRYSDEELYRFLLEAESTGDPHVLLAALLGADQGMRRSEIVTLQHNDVDLAKMEITIKRGLSNEVEGETKSGRERTIPMSLRVAELLRRHPHALGVPQVIWHTYKGAPRRYTANGLYRCFSEIQVRMGLRTGVHILRHTAASRLADRGASQAQVAAYLGHSRPSTSDIYVHVSAEGVRGLLDDAAVSGERLEKSRN